MKHIITAKYKCFVLFIEIFIVILLLPIVYNYVPIDKNAPTTFYIPSSDIDDIVYALEKNGYTVTLIDMLMLTLIETPQKGWYHVDHDEYGRLLFFATIHHKKTETMDIVVYAGETAEELVTRLSKDMKLDKVKLQQKYKTLTRFQEADIFAKRYSIARKANEKITIEYLFDLSNAQLSKFEKENFSQTPDTLTLKVLLTIASIIQKESNSVKEMPIISSVIHNRLDKGMRLQMDSTLNYGEHSHVIVTSERIKSDKSYYNTYKYKGLPPYPLGTVTLAALKAAMSPQKSDYLFFMLDPKGGHNFTATYDKHLENIRAFRVYQKERAEQKKIEAKQKKKAQAKKQKKVKKEEKTKLKKDTNKTLDTNTSK
ncbi:endolytic transglycosylase MltG [Sulfurovum sp. CS9]|uniref:endolytic transglycosylase MltG n=1 Tax=Sulfurovum sp. CS9 TaxID=3391146 RepID=UPI0039E995BC